METRALSFLFMKGEVLEMFEKKRGRPEKEVRKDMTVRARLTPEEFRRLQAQVNETGETYSDVVRKALRVYYYMTKKE